MLAEVAIILSDLVETIKNNTILVLCAITVYRQSANIWDMVIVSGQMQIIQCFQVKYKEKN